MVRVAEDVEDPVLIAVTGQEQPIGAGLRAAESAGLVRPFIKRPRTFLARLLPLGALDLPGDHVLEPAEDGSPLAARVAEPEAVIGRHFAPTPRARLHHAARLALLPARLHRDNDPKSATRPPHSLVQGRLDWADA